MPLETFNIIIGAGTLGILLCIIAFGIVRLVFGKNSSLMQNLVDHALPVGFFLGLMSVIGSLTYSEFYGLPPCLFCWWQRIFLYPQTILFGMALYRHGRKSTAGYDIFYYSTPIAVIGTLVSAYHVFLQQGVIADTGACLANGVSCTSIDVQVFGFLTIPMMALILGIGLSLLGWLVLTTKKPR